MHARFVLRDNVLMYFNSPKDFTGFRDKPSVRPAPSLLPLGCPHPEPEPPATAGSAAARSLPGQAHQCVAPHRARLPLASPPPTPTPTPTPTAPQGVVLLEEGNVRTVETGALQKYTFMLAHPNGESVVLAAETEKEMHEWMQAGALGLGVGLGFGFGRRRCTSGCKQARWG